MTKEQSKAAKRRYSCGAFHNRFFAGDGIDIGSGSDPLGRYAGGFARMRSCRSWDVEDGDASLLEEVEDNSFDFLHSSHCLEDLEDVRLALENWIRVVKPGGHLVISVPDEDMYEQGVWPSRFNRGHKWTFTVCKKESWSPRSINILELLVDYSDRVSCEKLEVVRDFFNPALISKGVDQTASPVVESCIELVLRKRP